MVVVVNTVPHITNVKCKKFNAAKLRTKLCPSSTFRMKSTSNDCQLSHLKERTHDKSQHENEKIQSSEEDFVSTRTSLDEEINSNTQGLVENPIRRTSRLRARSGACEEDFISTTSACVDSFVEEMNADAKVPMEENITRKTSLLRIKRGCTTDFIVHITIVLTALLLAQLIFRENGLTSEQLDPFINISWLWIFSLSGGYLAKVVNLPSLVGMLGAGILTSNLSDIDIPERWRAVCTSAGLAIIMLRSGLELDLESVKKSSMMTMRLTCIPGSIEALVCGMGAMYLFGMPLWLGLSLGFILAAVSPAVVVSGMLELQNAGYGVDKGIPSLVIASASFDDIFAIGGFSICIALAIKNEDTSILHAALHGPLSIIIGIVLGIMTGIIMSLTKIWDCTWKKSSMIMLIALTLMFGMKSLSYPGSGAMGAITLGIVSSFVWNKEDKSTSKVDSSYRNDVSVQRVESNISLLWDMIFEPLLFGCIGSALNFKLIEPNTVAKSIAIVSLGSSVRLCAAFLAVSGNGFSTRERLFISLSWLPKATVQAALCSFPLQLVRETLSTTDSSYAVYLEWAENILSTSILSICITAPLGVLCIKFLGKKWLEKNKGFVSLRSENEEPNLENP